MDTSNFSDTSQLVDELQKNVFGEVKFDELTRMLYSTDASIYQMTPIGVVIPKDSDDVSATIEIANKHSIPLLPRGGGTSLAGQTVGNAIVIDFSKYMRDIIEINSEEKWVRTQPGIVLDELNRQIKQSNLMFTPDPSTSNRGNVGGAIGNNSCGAHSIIWGKTSDNILDIQTILSNGDKAKFGPISKEEFRNISLQESLEGNIYKTLTTIINDYKDEISSKYPNIQRRVGGYNLDHFISKESINMAEFLVGSEGTLITATEAKLKLVDIPKYKGLSVLHFNDLIESMEATVDILDLNPAAIEHIGNSIINQTRQNLSYSRISNFIDGNPNSLLVVEFIGDTEKEVVDQLKKLKSRAEQRKLGYSTLSVTSPQEQSKVWAVRKAGLGLLMSKPGDSKPLPFVEDTAVSPEKLPQFIQRFDQIVKENKTEADYYGHASVGCLHIRPLVNLKTDAGIKQMKDISDAICELVIEFGGSLSGEHGDGLVRSHLNEKIFGPKIYEAFHQVKNAFDPKGLMNPGKIIDSSPMEKNLRIDPNYSTQTIPTGFSYSKEGGFAKAIEMCNGQGACRKLDGTMCPSYMATRDEEHSTRGRATALRSAISGDLPIESLTSARMHQVLDLCLECKGCKSECPSSVDMAKLKYDFLNLYHKKNGQTLRNFIFGNISLLSKMGSLTAPISNWILQSPLMKELLEKYVGIDKRREMPVFSATPFTQWYKSNNSVLNQPLGKVLLFPDTFTNYNHPEIGKAAVKLIEALGYEVEIPDVKCCGRPMLSSGMMDKAKKHAQYNIESLYSHLYQGKKLIGLEPSCILGFLDDFNDLVDEETREKGLLVSKNTMLIEEFILFALENGSTINFKNPPKTIAFHGHCHQKAMVGTDPALKTLQLLKGTEISEINSGCCGMAGSFGFEKEHFDISNQIGERELLPAIRNSSTETAIISEGVSCRQQIFSGTGKNSQHLVEILANSL